MYYIKNKYLVDSNGKYYKTVDNEYFLTANTAFGSDYNEYVKAVRSNLSFKVIKLYLLNKDETVYKDVSSYAIAGNVTYNYQQGQTHSLSLTLINEDDFWVPEPVTGNVWNGTKFRLDVGIYSNGGIYWRKCGIFVVGNVSLTSSPKKQISLQLYDKFALFDGKINGKIDSDFKINVGTPIKEAIRACVAYEDETNGVGVYDTKEVIFESELPVEEDGSEIKTPYTITKTPGATLGDIIIELANMVSQDVFYNENGNLTLRAGYDALPDDARGVQWHYTQIDKLDYADATYSINYGAIINKFIVKGSIIKGKQNKGIAINDNPWSKSNVMLNQINSEVLEDKNIYSDDLALERAKYELNKRLISYAKNSYKSIFVPHLMPKDIVMWTCPDFNIYNEKFKIQSLSFPLEGDFLMSVDMTNIKEIGV